ncbi:MAG: hypothetical protein IPJ65_39165 [Archangiaceae bacterium]|nr:hypothetical protein [Archangiaceae bacterium]
MTLYRRSPQGGDDPASSTFYWASAFELSVTREASGNVHHLVATLVPLSAYDVETRVVDETQALTLTSNGPISLGCSSVSNGAVTLLRSDDPLCAPALP